MVDVLVVVDGASEPLGAAPTSLERARTPVLDRLAAEGELTRLRIVAPDLPTGSETAIPTLLGWHPPAPVDRGAIEAAARGVVVSPGRRAWRVDVGEQGKRANATATRRAAEELRRGAPDYVVDHLADHRLLLTGPAPLPAAALAPGLRVWPEGSMPPRLLGFRTVVVGAPGAAIGTARLMGAATIVPAGATGQPHTDLAAKAAAADGAIAAGAERVVLHVGGPDEAAHRRDRAEKIAAIERVDRELVAPLLEAARGAAGTLRICPDHGCDPATGRHHPGPVPCLTWMGAGADARLTDRAGARLTERAVAHLPVVDLPAAERVAA